MKDFKTKFKRQFEILGVVIANPDRYIITDFEESFGVNGLTIKRDLSELRELGFDIHSRKGRGLKVHNSVPDEIIKNIVLKYIGIAVDQSSYNKATNFLIGRHHLQAVSILTILQSCIETGKVVKIKYEKVDEGIGKEKLIIEERTLEPYCIFQSDKNWRLLANHEGTIKQFILTKIKGVDKLNKKFKRITQGQIDEIFSTSFKSWLGNERYKVRLKLLPPWVERMRPNKLMESQNIIEGKDGTIIFETVVNSLKEIASWVVSRGEGVIVIEPAELRELVIKTAHGVLNNYD